MIDDWLGISELLEFFYRELAIGIVDSLNQETKSEQRLDQGRE